MSAFDDPRITIGPALPRGLSRFQDGPAGRLYLGPAGLLSGKAAAAALAGGSARPLAGGAEAFPLIEVVRRRPDGGAVLTVASLAEVLAWAEEEGVAGTVTALLDRLVAARPAFAGLDMGRVHLMGVLNVTPDSFSDGGLFVDPARAIAHGLDMRAAGADIIDVGGESTRPGAAPVTVEDEIARVVPVIAGLTARGVAVSIDTRHPAVMRAAVKAGATVINDVSALTAAPDALRTAADLGVPVILMHMQGEPGTMQRAPDYDCAPLDVFDYLESRVNACLGAGIAPERLCVDPGIGFGKTAVHNLSILARLGLLHGLGVPLLVGASRKSLIAHVCGDVPVAERLPGSLAVALDAARRGARILRVHDVAETRQALAVASAMASA